jgi:hypothetical protein
VIQLACEIHALGVTLIWMQDIAVPNRKASQNVKVEATFADVSCPDMEVSRLFSPRANGKSDGTTLAISGDISVDLLKKILKQAGISRSEWLRSG